MFCSQENSSLLCHLQPFKAQIMPPCPSMKMAIPQFNPPRNRFFQDHCRNHSLLRRSSSSEELYRAKSASTIRRSSSDNQLYCCYHHHRAASRGKSKQNKQTSVGIFSFELSSNILPKPISSLLFDTETVDGSGTDLGLNDDDNGDDEELGGGAVEEEENEMRNMKAERVNWVERLVELRQQWSRKRQKRNIRDGHDEEGEDGIMDEEEGCDVDYEEEEQAWDSRSFSSLLSPVQRSDTKRLSQLAFLCHRAYFIPEIKNQELKEYYGLNVATSSVVKKADAAKQRNQLGVYEDEVSTTFPLSELSTFELDSKRKVSPMDESRSIHPSLAYQIAASNVKCRASVPSQPVETLREREVSKSKRAAYMATSTMTAVVAAREKEKQKAAKDLQSIHSSPCEWFICDDPGSGTRYFVIQGSDSLASWQTNLFFEPTTFEGKEVLVHRGIYEAAKGIYEQLMPEIKQHLNAYGENATFQFTGHSLGGSLSLLVHLMLIARNVIKPSTLLPVVTFGAPFVFCQGQKLLEELGLDESQVHNIIMHRDIVPRAFSCNYPKQVALILKRLNSTFRSHPCLNKHKLLYSPLGQIFILQPDEKISPSHPLLPRGSALYSFNKAQGHTSVSALRAFINNPHPLETLSDPMAYGSEGTIIRDHDSSRYLKAVNGVMRQHTKMDFRKMRKERQNIWPLLSAPSNGNCSNEVISQTITKTKELMTGALELD